MKKIVLPISLITAFALTGCGGGGSVSSDTKEAKVKAADAYVVKLESPATAEYNGHTYESTTVNKNGEIVFKVPKNFDEAKAYYQIPKDAWVDVDMDGKCNEHIDKHIRMALKAYGNYVANPIGTVILEQDKPDMKLYEKYKNYDPVEAKEAVIKNPSDATLMAKVIAADSIAFALEEASAHHKNAHETCKAIRIETLKNIDSYKNNSVALVNDLMANTDTDIGALIDKAQKEAQNIINAHKEYINGKEDQAIKDVIKFTDGDGFNY